MKFTLRVIIRCDVHSSRVQYFFIIHRSFDKLHLYVLIQYFVATKCSEGCSNRPFTSEFDELFNSQGEPLIEFFFWISN